MPTWRGIPNHCFKYQCSADHKFPLGQEKKRITNVKDDRAGDERLDACDGLRSESWHLIALCYALYLNIYNRDIYNDFSSFIFLYLIWSLRSSGSIRLSPRVRFILRWRLKTNRNKAPLSSTHMVNTPLNITANPLISRHAVDKRIKCE